MAETAAGFQPDQAASRSDNSLTIYQRMKENALKGGGMDVNAFLNDVGNLDSTGALTAGSANEQPRWREQILQVGQDPLLWQEVYKRIQGGVRIQDQQQIQRDLRLAHLLSMDQSNPQDDPRRQAVTDQISQWKTQYGPRDEGERKKEKEDEALSLFTQYTQEQGIRAGTRQEYEALLEAVGHYADQLTTEQLTQLPPYLLLRLMTEGHLKPEQIAALPDNSEYLKLIMEKDVTIMEIEYFRQAQVGLQEVLKKYSDSSIFGSATRGNEPGLTIDELERRTHDLLKDIEKDKPSELDFKKGGPWWLPFKGIEERKDQAYRFLSKALDNITHTRRLMLHEEYLDRLSSSPQEPQPEIPSSVGIRNGQVAPEQAEPASMQGETLEPALAQLDRAPEIRQDEVSLLDLDRQPIEKLLELARAGALKREHLEQLAQRPYTQLKLITLIEESALPVGQIAQLEIAIDPSFDSIRTTVVDYPFSLNREEIRAQFAQFVRNGVIDENVLTNNLLKIAIANWVEAYGMVVQHFPVQQGQRLNSSSTLEFRNNGLDEKTQGRFSRLILSGKTLIGLDKYLTEGGFSLSKNKPLTILQEDLRQLPSKFREGFDSWLAQRRAEIQRGEIYSDEQLKQYMSEHPYYIARLLWEGLLSWKQVQFLYDQIHPILDKNVPPDYREATAMIQQIESSGVPAKPDYSGKFGFPLQQKFDHWLASRKTPITYDQLAKVALASMIHGLHQFNYQSQVSLNLKYGYTPLGGAQEMKDRLRTWDINPHWRTQMEWDTELARCALSQWEKWTAEAEKQTNQ